MSIFPDLKLMSQIKGLDIYAQAISQGSSQLMNASNKDSDDYRSLKDYMLETIGEFKGTINEIEARLIG